MTYRWIYVDWGNVHSSDLPVDPTGYVLDSVGEMHRFGPDTNKETA